MSTTSEALALGLCGWCTVRPATETCPKTYAAFGALIGKLTVCRTCHAAARISYPCKCLSLEEAKRIYESEDSRMAKKKLNGSADGKIERARYEEKLPCKVEPEEVEVHAQELAKVIRERQEMLSRKRSANAAFREKIAFFDERLKELAECVEGKTVRKPVTVIEYLLERTNEVQVVRSDTGEIVSSRAADAADLQDQLFSEGANPAPVGKGRAKKKSSKDEPHVTTDE
jgi:hypothetical protein